MRHFLGKNLLCSIALIGGLMLAGLVLRWVFPDKPLEPESINDPLLKMFYTDPNRFLDEILFPNCDCMDMTEHVEKILDKEPDHSEEVLKNNYEDFRRLHEKLWEEKQRDSLNRL